MKMDERGSGIKRGELEIHCNPIRSGNLAFFEQLLVAQPVKKFP